VATFIFYLGYLYRQHEDKIKFNSYYVLAAVILLLTDYQYGIKTDMRINSYADPVFFVINALLGIYLTIYISKKISKYNVSILNYIGRNTFTVLALHVLCLRAFNHMWFLRNRWVICSIIGVAIPIGLKYLYDLLRTKIIDRNLKVAKKYQI
jgi:fucose 4-O-acetylase-like acetyltransferase